MYSVTVGMGLMASHPWWLHKQWSPSVLRIPTKEQLVEMVNSILFPRFSLLLFDKFCICGTRTVCEIINIKFRIIFVLINILMFLTLYPSLPPRC